METFLSTLSLRRATRYHAVGVLNSRISIHALLAESDLADCTKIYAFGDFYPRSPCGERRRIPQNHLPANGISIHALLAESDLRRSASIWLDKYFYPRSPCGERLTMPDLGKGNIRFLSTLSLRRATAIVSRSSISCQFLSTLSLRRATLRRSASI